MPLKPISAGVHVDTTGNPIRQEFACHSLMLRRTRTHYLKKSLLIGSLKPRLEQRLHEVGEVRERRHGLTTRAEVECCGRGSARNQQPCRSNVPNGSEFA